MRTKEEIIESYLGDDDPDYFEVRMNSELVKDVMNLWGQEILQELMLEIGNAGRKIEGKYLTQTRDMEMLDIIKRVRLQMYPNPTFD